jgi:DNA-binding protein H-NS
MTTETLDEVLTQIKALEKKAEEMRNHVRAAAIAEAKNLVTKYMLTAEELGLDGKKTKGRARIPSGKLVKYRSDKDPALTYAGRGPKPKWLAAEIAAGRKMEDFAV